MPRGLVFDLDGVIVDSNPVHVEAWAGYLESHGRRLPPCAGRLIFGRRNDEIVRDFFGADLREEVIVAHGAAKEALYREMMRPQLRERLVPGVEAFLMRHSGVPMALASNAERANVEFVLEGAGLRTFFTAVLDGGRVGRPKPFPDIYLEAARLLGVHPADCIVFEDSEAGIQAARAAGARVVGLRTTHRDLGGVDLAIRDFLDPELELWLKVQGLVL